MRGFETWEFFMNDGSKQYRITNSLQGWVIHAKDFSENQFWSQGVYVRPDGKWTTTWERMFFPSAEDACDWFWRNVMKEEPEETMPRSITL
jgi:hypothetical protein